MENRNMLDLNVDAFNFDAMKEAVGVDPFAKEANKYASDDRFYTLAKDKDGNGAALIRFLPDSGRGMIQKMFKINTTIVKNGKKRFVSQFSPVNAGLPCPFQEEWQNRWNSGDKEGAKLFSRGMRFVANIKVLKDPANPENEGKIFMYEMSGAMKDKIQGAVDPSEQDRSLGAVPKQLFNPLQGNSFRLVAKKGANNQINYDSSEVVSEIDSIYDNVEDAIADINENSYKLSDLLKADQFLSYDELVQKMAWVQFSDETAVASVQPGVTAEVAEVQQVKPEVQEAQPSVITQVTPKAIPASDSLDDLLAGLV
jgi:hypothetical protein